MDALALLSDEEDDDVVDEEDSSCIHPATSPFVRRRMMVASLRCIKGMVSVRTVAKLMYVWRSVALEASLSQADRPSWTLAACSVGHQVAKLCAAGVNLVSRQCDRPLKVLATRATGR